MGRPSRRTAIRQTDAVRYAELTPQSLARTLSERPVAIWPIGALEWHGSHLPLGLDGLVAEAFAERLQDRVGGVLLPTYWHPITTLPHPMSLDVATDTFRSLFRRTAIGLGKAGVRVLCVVTGHYAQGHSLELFELAEEFNRSAQELNVVAAAPLEPLENEALLDHAGRWETAQLLALRPDLVALSELPTDLHPKRDAVLGDDPRLAKAEEAETFWREAESVWERWIEKALNGDLEELTSFYVRRKNHYQPYVAKHFRESWDQAIQDWWASLS